MICLNQKEIIDIGEKIDKFMVDLILLLHDSILVNHFKRND